MEDKAKEDMLNNFRKLVRYAGKCVKESDKLSTKEQQAQAKVVMNMMKFLNDYEENVQVLDKYWLEKVWKDKFKKDEGR